MAATDQLPAIPFDLTTHGVVADLGQVVEPEQRFEATVQLSFAGGGGSLVGTGASEADAVVDVLETAAMLVRGITYESAAHSG
ncbi:MAG TPA: hypothetical protein VFL77_05375 [Solirubrobacterales bacterium]|nr:hypothetical protein [Solirubrobacterales bacterium]